MGNGKSKYEARTHEEIKQIINTYGICYVPCVLDEEEIVKMLTGTWHYFEHLTKNDELPVEMSNPKSWQEIQSLQPDGGMLFHKYNAGHSQHMWNLRQNSQILSIWSTLLECSYLEMLVSFDGFSFLLPPEETHDNWHSDNEIWYHLDQSLYSVEQDGFQSFVTAYDMDENDATIRFFEKSHLLTQKFVDTFGYISDTDWVPFHYEHVQWWKQQCSESAIKCPAGSLVIWDSRLVHYGGKPKRCRKHARTKCTAYLSYSCRNKADEKTIAKKIHGFENKCTSNHYAHRASFFPQGDISEITPIENPTLNHVGYLLAGYSLPST